MVREHEDSPLYTAGDLLLALDGLRRLVADCGLDHLLATVPTGRKRQRLLHAALVHDAMQEIRRIEGIVKTGSVEGMK